MRIKLVSFFLISCVWVGVRTECISNHFGGLIFITDMPGDMYFNLYFFVTGELQQFLQINPKGRVSFCTSYFSMYINNSYARKYRIRHFNTHSFKAEVFDTFFNI